MISRILVYRKNLPPEIIEGDFENDLELQTKLRLLTQAPLQEDYVWDVKEYPGKIKKIFIKGNSKKNVPRQVLNINTETFISNAVVFSSLDVEFGEL